MNTENGMKERILFVCVQNSSRSQMAEAWCNYLYGDMIEAESAGLEPGELNPLVVEAMKEVGIDISENTASDVFEFYKQGRVYSYIVSVCDPESSERCPVFPAIKEHLQWSFKDPHTFTGPHEEQMEQIRDLRDRIRDKVKELGERLSTAFHNYR